MASVATPFSSQFYGQALSDVFAGSSFLSSGKCVHSLTLCLWPAFLSGSPLSASGSPEQWFYLFLFIVLPHFLQQPSCRTLTPSLSADGHDPPIMRKQGWESWMWSPLAFCPQQADLHMYARLHPLLQLMRKRLPLPAQDQSLLTILPALSFLGTEPCSMDYFLSLSVSDIFNLFLFMFGAHTHVHVSPVLRSACLDPGPSLTTNLSFSFPAGPSINK